jgi:chromate transporter
VAQSPSQDQNILPAAQPPTLRALFLIAFKIGVLSFGGGLSGWFYQELVFKRRWISDADFASSHAMSQMLPGPNIVNLIISISHQLCGPAGVALSILGFIIGPFFAVIALASLFAQITNIGLVQAASAGVTFASLGLMSTVCLRGIKRAMQFRPSLVVLGATALAVGVFRWPLIPVVISLAPISIVMAWRKL